MRDAFIIAGSLIVLTSCGGGSNTPTAPTSPRYAAGTWEGRYTTDGGALSGTLRLVLQQDASGSITGTATLALPGLTLPPGAVTGALQPSATPPAPIGFAFSVAGACPATLSAPSTLTTATTLDGVVAGGNPVCGVDVAGRFALVKQ